MDWQGRKARTEPRNETRRAALAARLLATTAIVLCSYPLQSKPATAQTATRGVTVRAFNIPAQPLASALNAFGRQSGLQVTLASSTTRGITSRPVSGSFTSQQALAQMLEGTGIPFRINSDRTAVVGARQATNDAGGALPAGAIPLDQIEVQGAGNPNSTMTPMPAYAGGQVATGGQVGMLGNRNVMNTPFSQTSFTRKLIEDQQARTVNDVLANDPSVMTPASGTASGWQFETIRGFQTFAHSANRSLNGLPGMAPMASPSTDFVERVEVLKGPSALLNGLAANSGNIGGAVNLVTKQAEDEPLTQLTARYASRSQLGGHVDIGRRFGDNKEFGIRFNGSYGGGGTPIHPQRSDGGSAALNLDYRGERVRLSADIVHQAEENNGGANYLLISSDPFVPKAPDASKSLLPSWAKVSQKITLGMFRAELDITDDITLYGAIGAQKFDRYYNGNGWTFLNDPSGSYSYLPWAQRASTDVLAMQGGLRAKATTGPVDHSLNLNLSQSQYRNFSTPDSYGPFINAGSIYNPIFGPAPMLPALGPRRNRSETEATSIAIADTMSIFNERIQFTAGVRYQEVGVANWNVNTGALTSDYNGKAWSPAFGLVVKPWENVSLYANY